MLRVPQLAKWTMRLGARAVPTSRAIARPTFRPLCSGAPRLPCSSLSPFVVAAPKEPKAPPALNLQKLADQADYPREAREMLTSFPDDFIKDMNRELSAMENPVGGLNDIVEMWMEPEGSADHVDAGTAEFLAAAAEDDDLDPEELEEEVSAHVDSVFDEMGADFDFDYDDEDEAGEWDEEGESSPPAGGPEVDDWRRLQTMTHSPADADSDEQLQQKHAWFKTKRLALLCQGENLPPAQAAGSNPLSNVFGMSVAAPTYNGTLTGRPVTFYPGQMLDPAQLNPPRFDDGKPYSRVYDNSRRVVKKRKCPFNSGHVPMPDHKNVGVITRFVSEGGKILPRRRTGISAKNQRQFAKTVKRARQFGLIPTTSRLQRPMESMYNHNK